jgi:hypothetical protein
VFLGEALGDEGPNLAWLEDAASDDVVALCDAITVAVAARDKMLNYDTFDQEVRKVTERLGDRWTSATSLLRRILGQSRGLPGRRLLYHLPIGTLVSVRAAAGWLVASRQNSKASGAARAVVSTKASRHP